MEFATEVYLNDLLLNAEANGFESAKESFYECINSNEPATEATAGEVTAAVVGGILALPVLAVGAAVALAIVIVGSLLALLYAIIKFIVTLPIRIAKLIKAGGIKKAGVNIANNEGGKFADAYVKYYKDVKDTMYALLPHIKHVDAITASSKNDFTNEQVAEVESMSDKLKKNSEDFSSAKTTYEEVMDKFLEKSNDPVAKTMGKYSLVPISENSWKNVATNCKYMTAMVREYTDTLEKFKDKLNKTKQACDKAKASGDKTVKLNSQDTIATENSNKVLKASTSIVKAAGDIVKISAKIVESANYAEAPGATGEVADSVKRSEIGADTAERDAQLGNMGEKMRDNIKNTEWYKELQKRSKG